ncbi:XdhC family protein [Paenibacillus allorhizosphaerae]|uniref:Xanthine dehydrogenase subunit A n=1 Tax=Paenibacillus allorhizosphaerae TaxID=2849866 RepID=A0ABM8VA97_9BACL|nr:XdhC family protein [Paenibacillus allorhizosphaerae]CAG7615874.1 putative xanthine dehydrogenase subunit A [Paenibacillus allorhizosphaerae]
MEDIHRLLETIQRADGPSVLATITHVEGSAYRKEGASMLFLEDGSQIGVLSAGCLEADLAARVPEILERGASCEVVFDMQASTAPLSWGEDSGCGGVVHVMMEPVDDALKSHLRTLKACLDQRTEVVHFKKIGLDRSVSEYGFLTEKQYRFGEWGGDLPQSLLDWMHCGEARRSGMNYVSSMQSEVYVHTFYPKPRLFIFGAGPDARPLAAFAAATGFSVIVADWRAALCDRHYFPDAEAIIAGFPEEVMEQLPCTPYDCAIVMTHHFGRDRQLVRLLSDRGLWYLGILGSRKRAERLLQGDMVPAEVHSPVGMAIGAQGPAEIAVSILADLIRTYRQLRMRENVAHEAK